MLPTETVDEIKKIAPVLSINGEKIKIQFIAKLQQDAPELLHIFYHFLQKTGRYQISLIDAVYSAAMQIEHIDRFVPAVMQVAHKHRSLGILPEHYPIVGKHLLSSIREVLGENVSEEQLCALQLTYNRIADIFIQVEEDLYQEVEANGGWRFFKPFRIVKKYVKNELEMYLYIVPKDGQLAPIQEAGRYVSVRLKMPGEIYFMNHQYTVTEETTLGGYVLSIYRGPSYHMNNRVTNYIFDELVEGDLLDVSAPAGLFTLKNTEAPLLFISSGIGMTTLKNLVESINKNATNHIVYIHCAQNEEVVVFQEEIQATLNQLPNAHYEVLFKDKGQTLTKELLRTLTTTKAEVYLCGSKPFMESVSQQLQELDFDKMQINCKFFGPTMLS